MREIEEDKTILSFLSSSHLNASILVSSNKGKYNRNQKSPSANTWYKFESSQTKSGKYAFGEGDKMAKNAISACPWCSCAEFDYVEAVDAHFRVTVSKAGKLTTGDKPDWYSDPSFDSQKARFECTECAHHWSVPADFFASEEE
jgi:hypothetical protein